MAETEDAIVLKMLEARRARLIRDLENLDTAIRALWALGPGDNATLVGDAPQEDISHKYRGVPNFQAAVDYMRSGNIKEISLTELTQALLDRGVSFGKDPKRYSMVLKIAITQNNEQGRKEITVEKKTNRVILKSKGEPSTLS